MKAGCLACATSRQQPVFTFPGEISSVGIMGICERGLQDFETIIVLNHRPNEIPLKPAPVCQLSEVPRQEDRLRRKARMSVRQQFSIGTIGLFPAGRVHSIEVNGRAMILVRTDAGIFVALNQCPHMGLRLDNGTVLGNILVCLWHGAQFNLETGACLRWAVNDPPPEAFGETRRPLITFPVIVDGEQLYVEFEM